MAIVSNFKPIILIGFMGSGKSTIGKLLANELHYDFVDTDLLIEKKEGCTIKDIFSIHGEAYFRRCEKEIFDHDIENMKNCVISTGGGFPIGLKDLNQKGFVVYLNIPYESIIARLSATEQATRPLLKDPQESEKLYRSRAPVYQQRADLTIDGSLTPKEIVTQIVSHYCP